jgi:hypothetical protein
MKQCQKIKDLFGSYLYNTITLNERTEVEKHLQTCQECSEDLKTRHKVLGKIGKYIADSENANVDQERFMWNVYKKIATDSIRQKRKQMVVRKFVLQPAIATFAVVLIISFVAIKFRSNDAFETTGNIPVASVQSSKEANKETKQIILSKQIVKAKPMIIEKTKRENTTTVAKKANEKPKSSFVQSKPDVLISKAKSSNSSNWLKDADFIYFSLNDSMRALSKYEMIIKHYPDTDAAREAKIRIDAIIGSEIGSEFSSQEENTGNIELIKTGI